MTSMLNTGEIPLRSSLCMRVGCVLCTCSSFSTFSLRPLRRLLWAFRAVKGGVTSTLADSGLALPPVIHAAAHLNSHAACLIRSQLCRALESEHKASPSPSCMSASTSIQLPERGHLSSERSPRAARALPGALPCGALAVEPGVRSEGSSAGAGMSWRLPNAMPPPLAADPASLPLRPPCTQRVSSSCMSAFALTESFLCFPAEG